MQVVLAYGVDPFVTSGTHMSHFTTVLCKKYLRNKLPLKGKKKGKILSEILPFTFYSLSGCL
jgi:hypothetical protein